MPKAPDNPMFDDIDSASATDAASSASDTSVSLNSSPASAGADPLDVGEDAAWITRTPARTEGESGGGFHAHAKLIAGLTLLSRFGGLAREMVAGHFLGTGLVASAFTVAFTIPNLFRKLFGEGALAAAFIPLYSQVLRKQTPQAAAEFARSGFSLLVMVLLAITIVGEVILAAVLIAWPGLRIDWSLTIRFAMIMLPYVLLICATAYASGILQVHRRFAAPAAAPLLLNICHIAVVFIGAWFLGLSGRSDESTLTLLKQTRLAFWLAGFVLLAGVLQLLILLPGLRAVGASLMPTRRFWNPLVRKMLLLTVPVAISAGVLQLSVLLDKTISVAAMQGHDAIGNPITETTLLGRTVRLPMENGAPARLNVAQFLYQFPLGVFAIALATAVFPRLAAHAAETDPSRFKHVLRQGLEATLFEGLPASLGLMLVAEPTVRLLFQHGQITAHDATLITRSVVIYASAIWSFGLLQIINRAYYALHDTRTPLVMSFLNIAINLVVEIPLLWWMGEAALPVGTVVSFVIQSLLMLVLLDRRLGGMDLNRSLVPVGQMLLATLAMGLAVLAVRNSGFYPAADSRAAWGTQLALLMGVGGAVYGVTSYSLGIDAMYHVLPRRLRRREAGK